MEGEEGSDIEYPIHRLREGSSLALCDSFVTGTRDASVRLNLSDPYTLPFSIMQIGTKIIGAAMLAIGLSVSVTLIVQKFVIHRQGVDLTIETMRAAILEAENVRESISALGQRGAFDRKKLFAEYLADEVRALAQRCANAARETATKIEDCVQKSQRGVQISA